MIAWASVLIVAMQEVTMRLPTVLSVLNDPQIVSDRKCNGSETMRIM